MACTLVALTLQQKAIGQSAWELGARTGLYFSPTPLEAYESGGKRGMIRRQLPALVLGLGAAFWSDRWIGVEGVVQYSPSMQAITDSLRTRDMPAGIVVASLRALAGRCSAGCDWDWYGGVGLSMIGRAIGTTRYRADPAGGVALGARLGLTHSVFAVFELNEHVSRQGRAWRHDLVWNAGLTFRAWGGGRR